MQTMKIVKQKSRSRYIGIGIYIVFITNLHLGPVKFGRHSVEQL